MDDKQKEKLKNFQKQLEVHAKTELKKHPESALIEKAQNKEKLSIDEQIKYLKVKGIGFNYTTEEEAKEYLLNNSYYYKFTSYRKNFYQGTDKKYNELEFFVLKDLAIIDMHLRYLFIQLSLDIEHALKTLLIKLITESDEDGYKIVDEYNTYQYNSIEKNKHLTEKEKVYLQRNFIHSSENILNDTLGTKRYNQALYDKHKSNPSIWVLIELMTYGKLSSFIKFYVTEKKFGSTKLELAKEIMHFSKNIRDVAAHSQPLLLNVVGPSQLKDTFNPKPQLRNYALKAKITKIKGKELLHNYKINDFTSLLLLHETYIINKHAKQERKKELRKVLKRTLRERKKYPANEEFHELLIYFLKLVKHYNN